MIAINRSLILSLKVQESNLFVKMLNGKEYVFKNNIKISYEDFYQNIGKDFFQSDKRNEHKPWDLMDYELYYYILFSKKDFIELVWSE